MISVAGLLRPDSPTRGPPFVPSRITLVDFFCWPNPIRRSNAFEIANPVAAVTNCLRVGCIVYTPCKFRIGEGISGSDLPAQLAGSGWRKQTRDQLMHSIEIERFR